VVKRGMLDMVGSNIFMLCCRIMPL
jgi:hypothetical protein